MTKTATHIEADISEIHGFSRDELVFKFENLYRQSPPRKMGRELIARAVAHKLQLQQTNSSQSSLNRKLATYAGQLRQTGRLRIAPSTEMKPGSRLVREWQGKLHEVSIRDDGFFYQDQKYRSLSAIARDITGTRWSGPAFFGLKEDATRTGASRAT